MPKFQWALYQVDDSRRILEIDVEGIDVATTSIGEKSIARLMFDTGVVPNGVSLRSTICIGFERWTLHWAEGKRTALVAALNGAFQRFLLLPHLYGPRWRERAAKERLRQQAREIEYNIWRTKPQELFGGRSMADLAKLTPGAYEIVGKGFAWVGTPTPDRPTVEFHAMFPAEKTNNDIRWYLERGTSLSEAISLFNQQTRQLDAIAIAGFAVALADVAPNLTSGAAKVNVDWEKLAAATGTATSQHWVPLDSHRTVFNEAVKHFARSKVELRIQELDKKRPVPIVKLSAKR